MKIHEVRHSNLYDEIEEHKGVDNSVIVGATIIVAVCFLIFVAMSLVEINLITHG